MAELSHQDIKGGNHFPVDDTNPSLLLEHMSWHLGNLTHNEDTSYTKNTLTKGMVSKFQCIIIEIV